MIRLISIRNIISSFIVMLALANAQVEACSVLYYIDEATGNIFVVNNEDYWYDVDAYIQIEPRKGNKRGRLWYGWDKFAQGGVNEDGLFFDAAVTPDQEKIAGYGNPRSNLGDELLANCKDVDEAIAYLEQRKIALFNSHMMFGDRSGKAVIVEWVEGERKLHWIEGNKLIMTNYLLSNPEAGNYPCYRFESIEKQIQALENEGGDVTLVRIGNTVNKAVQPPRTDETGRTGGTLYTSFMNLTEMKFVLSYKLNNELVQILDLKEEFQRSKKKKIVLAELTAIER